MKVKRQLYGAVLKPWIPDHLVCTALQFAQGYQELLKESGKEEIAYDEEEKGLQKETQICFALEVESISLQCPWAL